MFISKRKHEEIVAQKDRVIDSWKQISDRHLVAKVRAIELRDQYKSQLAEALSELHALRAKRAKSNANLARANAARKARAQQKEMGA